MNHLYLRRCFFVIFFILVQSYRSKLHRLRFPQFRRGSWRNKFHIYPASTLKGLLLSDPSFDWGDLEIAILKLSVNIVLCFSQKASSQGDNRLCLFEVFFCLLWSQWQHFLPKDCKILHSQSLWALLSFNCLYCIRSKLWSNVNCQKISDMIST